MSEKQYVEYTLTIMQITLYVVLLWLGAMRIYAYPTRLLAVALGPIRLS